MRYGTFVGADGGGGWRMEFTGEFPLKLNREFLFRGFRESRVRVVAYRRAVWLLTVF
jgi:hypothetical protein